LRRHKPHRRLHASCN